MSQHDPVTASLEYVAERAGDVSLGVYRRFADRCPESAALMNHMDEYMRGRMLQDVFTLLMTPPQDIDRHYLGFEVDSHRAYGVTTDMFPPLLEVVRETVRHHLGPHWTADLAEAWTQRLKTITQEIDGVARPMV